MFKRKLSESEINNKVQSKQRVYLITGDSSYEYNPLSFYHQNRKFKNIHIYAIYSNAVYKNSDEERENYLTEMSDEFDSFMNSWKKITVSFPRPKEFNKGYFYLNRLKYELMLSPNKKKILIVFRGTDKIIDHYSNFRLFTQFFPFVHDHYDEVVYIIPELVKALQTEYGEDVEIITAGHSLGGGLAQQAAYTSPFINKAFVFNSSPVTGLLNLTLKEVYKTNLEIFRIYEHGEILEFFRTIKNKLLPPSLKDPRVELIRFNRQEGWSLFNWNAFTSQHEMERLAKQLNLIIEKNIEFKKSHTASEYIH